MGFFKKREKAAPSGKFDRENEKPIIKASICNGEQIAGFKNIHTGKMREIMLIKTSADLEYFKTMYGIETEIEKEYYWSRCEKLILLAICQKYAT